jgi:hypothetical protein
MESTDLRVFIESLVLRFHYLQHLWYSGLGAYLVPGSDNLTCFIDEKG